MSAAGRLIAAYRQTGADVPFGDPVPWHGSEMEGWFWRLTDSGSATRRSLVKVARRSLSIFATSRQRWRRWLGEGQRVDPTPVGLVSIDDGRSARCGRATRTRSSAGPLIVLLRNRSAFGFMRWERIWERNAAQRPRWRGTRRDGLDGREVVTCRSETREATGDGDRLAHNPEVVTAG